MKKLFFTLLTSISLFSFAQVPQEISYQGVARNTIGTVLSNQNISIKLDLHQGSASGTVVFSESHNKTTNAFGLFTLGIGSVNNSAFSSINWANGPYFLEVSMDPLGGTSYTAVGIQQFMSVPYALYAQTSGNASTTPTITINAPNTVTSAGGSYTINVPSSATYTAGSGININSGVISGTANIIGSGATTVTGTYPNLTINTPTVVSDQTVSITGINSATVTGTYPNFTVNVPSGSSLPNALSGQFLYHTGTIWDTLPRNNLYFDGTNFGIGTTNPQANFHVVGAGKFDASVSTPHVFTNTLSVSGGTLGQVLTSDASGNGTFQNLPVAQTPTITSTGIAVVTPTTGNTFNVSVPQPTLSYNNATNVLSLTHDGTTVSTATLVGTGTNTTSIVGTGLATVTPTTGSTFTVSVPNPTLSVASGSLSISGGNSVPIPTTSVVSTNTNISVSSSAGVYSLTAVSPSISGTGVIGSYPNYTINSTPNQTLSINSGSLSISGGNTVPIPTTSVVSTNTNISVTSSAGVYSLTAVPSNLSGDVLGAVNTTTVTKLQTRPVSNTAPTANQVLTWNGSAWTPSSTVVPILSYTGSATAGTLQSGAQTVTIPNYTLSNTSNTITLNNGTSNSTAIIPVPTLSLTGSILQSGPITNTVNLSSVPGLWTAPTATSVVTTSSISLVGIGTNNPTYKLDVYGTGSVPATIHGYNSGATVSSTGVFGENPNNGIGVYGQSGSGAGVWGKSTTGAGIYGESTNGDGGKFILSSNTTTANAVNAQTNGSGVALFAKSYNAIPLAAKFEGSAEIFHSATVLNPHLNIASASGSYGIIKFSNSGQSSYFTHDVINNGSGNNEAYSISHYNGINTKQVFLINGQRMAYINALNYPLATFHVMTSTATANGGIASEGFAQAGQLNIIRNNNAGAGARTSVFGGDEIGKINFAGFDGSNYGDGAKIYAKTTENVTGSNKGTELIFAAVPTGTNSNRDAFKINGAGNLEVISGLRVPVGAVSGHVLTSDAIGNASWQPITAPVAAWTSTLGNTYLVNSGDKVGIGTNTPAAQLTIANSFTAAEGVFVDNNSINNGVRVFQGGTGNGFFAHIANTSGGSGFAGISNSSGALFSGQNTGSGGAADFSISNPSNLSIGLQVSTNGGGSAMSATNFGSGTAGIISISSSTNTSTSLEVNSAGTGTSLFAVNTNASVLAYAGNFDGGLTVKGKTSASADYAFKVSSSISEVFGIKNNGNIGVNVLNPIYKVHVNSSNTVATLYSENIVTGSFPNAHGISGKVASSNTNTLAAGVFGNNAGAGPSIFGSKAATDISGNAGRFEILNTGNTADGIFTQTNGRGAAIHAVNGPTVTGSSNVALLLENGHMKSVGTTPTFTLNALASGTGVIGTDMVGKLSFTVLLSAILSNTDVITVKFDKPYSTVPNIIIIPNNGSSYAVNAYVNAATVNGFSLRFANNSGISTTYSFNYLVIE